jgi:hypothetical protein
VDADTPANRAHRRLRVLNQFVVLPRSRIMFSDISTRVGMCYIGAIIVLASALQLAG